MSGVTGNYDTDAMRSCAAQLTGVHTSLTGLTDVLMNISAEALPGTLRDALSDLGRKSRDMISDIAAESKGLADGLGQAAQCYDDLDQSMVAALGSP
jgi:hypothetical protein